jgi:hypothetical protein
MSLLWCLFIFLPLKINPIKALRIRTYACTCLLFAGSQSLSSVHALVSFSLVCMAAAAAAAVAAALNPVVTQLVEAESFILFSLISRSAGGESPTSGERGKGGDWKNNNTSLMMAASSLPTSLPDSTATGCGNTAAAAFAAVVVVVVC